MAVRVRKNAGKLPAWDDTFIWYARGIREMQKRPIANPTSWRYQAAVHDYQRNADPYRKASDVLPSTAEQRKFWRQCQHFSWFFLPWHRMYLGHFEQMIIAAIAPLGGPADWALPYWNYSEGDASRKLPKAFTDRKMPDGTDNPLFVRDREDGNDGSPVGEDTDTDLECLTEPLFESTAMMGAPGFGGPRTRFKHTLVPGEPARFGALEATPHGSMHVAVGGFMSSFVTAALDPIFWLHHCNIDRLWEVWLGRAPAPPGTKPPQFGNVTASAWASAVAFNLHDAAGNPVVMLPSSVTNSETSIFAYKYDDVADPLGPPEESAMVLSMAGGIPEMLGATESGFTLSDQRTTAQFAVSAPTGPVLEAGGAQRHILHIENITAERKTKGYSVYVNLPPDADPAAYRDHFAGNIPLFGIDAVDDPENPHRGEGLHYSLDITRVVRALRQKGQWNPESVQLTFVPKRRRTDLESAVEPVPVQVGRVSLSTE